MKKFFLIFFLFLSALAYAINPNRKILQSFETSFPTAENISWTGGTGDKYEVSFNSGKIKCRLWYDADGNIIKTTRYYSVESLCPFIMAKLGQKYADKKVFGVTEVSSDSGLFYYIILEDVHKWYQVTADSQGTLTLESKFNKA